MARFHWEEEDAAIDGCVTVRIQCSGGVQQRARWFLQRADDAFALVENKYTVARGAIGPCGEGEHGGASGREGDVFIGQAQRSIAAGHQYSTGCGQSEAREFRKNQVEQRGNIEWSESAVCSVGRCGGVCTASALWCARAVAIDTAGAPQWNPDLARRAP